MKSKIPYQDVIKQMEALTPYFRIWYRPGALLVTVMYDDMLEPFSTLKIDEDGLIEQNFNLDDRPEHKAELIKSIESIVSQGRASIKIIDAFTVLTSHPKEGLFQ